MPDYTAIPDSAVDPDAPITSELMYRLRDNPLGMAQGADGAPRIRTYGAFASTAPAAGAGVLAVPAFTMGVPSGFSPFVADPPSSAAPVPLEENFFFMCVGNGSLRVQSGNVGVTGAGAAELYLNGSVVAAPGDGASFNTVLTYTTNSMIRFRAWKGSRTNSVLVSNIQIRVAEHTLAVIPFKWGYGTP